MKRFPFLQHKWNLISIKFESDSAIKTETTDVATRQIEDYNKTYSSVIFLFSGYFLPAA